MFCSVLYQYFINLDVLVYFCVLGRHQISLWVASWKSLGTPALSPFLYKHCSFLMFSPSSHSLCHCFVYSHSASAKQMHLSSEQLFGNWVSPLADVFVTHQMLFWSVLSIPAMRHSWDHQSWSCFKHQSDSKGQAATSTFASKLSLNRKTVQQMEAFPTGLFIVWWVKFLLLHCH